MIVVLIADCERLFMVTGAAYHAQHSRTVSAWRILLCVHSYRPTRHGEAVFQVITSFVAQSVDLSVWHAVQGFGILYLSVIAGEMNLKVWELTKAPGTPWVSIFGLWHATH